MKSTELEPGFLQAFRLIVATRIVFWVVIGPILIVLQMARVPEPVPGEYYSLPLIQRLTLPNVGPMLLCELALLVLLVVPQVRRALGPRFVPVMLLAGLVTPLIGYYWWPSDNPLQTPFVLFFFVMLVLIAWHYPFRYVLAYVAGLTLYQSWIAYPLQSVPLSIDVGWRVLQASLMLIVGYIIVQLTSIYREQRAALAEAYEQQAAANARLQEYAATVEDLSISQERNRLARELHDTLAHSLSAVTVQLEAVRSLWAVRPDKAQAMLEQAHGTARRGLTEARRSLHALRASPLKELGLVLALRELAESAADRAGTALELHLPDRLAGALSPAVEQSVYRIAQESLENAVRHAEARCITLSLLQLDGTLTLVIEDDGRGLQEAPDRVPDGGPPRHLGIRGMRERASVIGGVFEIGGTVGGGTRVSLTVPVDNGAGGEQAPWSVS